MLYKIALFTYFKTQKLSNEIKENGWVEISKRVNDDFSSFEAHLRYALISLYFRCLREH